MPRRSSLRASDDDRERIAERLRQATIEGRLLAEELEERLGRLLRARTYGELDVLVADLPRGRSATPERRRPSTGVLVTRAAVVLVVAAIVLPIVIALVILAVTLATMMLCAALVTRIVIGRHMRRPLPPPLAFMPWRHAHLRVRVHRGVHRGLYGRH